MHPNKYQMLYNWNEYNVTCQLFLNEKEKNANLVQHLKMSNDNLSYNKLKKKFPMINSIDKDLNQCMEKYAMFMNLKNQYYQDIICPQFGL